MWNVLAGQIFHLWCGSVGLLRQPCVSFRLKVMASIQILNQKSLVIIFAYAAAGLGHLRVTNALYHGLPPGITPLLLRTQDSAVTYMHRLTSIYPLGRKFLEWTQKGWPEEIFTRTYRWYLRNNNWMIHQQMSTILSERVELPKTVLIVATHFGLAHQLAALKARLEDEEKVKIYLVVQVTDDSPQRFWYVAGADIIFVPSEKTKEALEQYGRKSGLPPVRLEVLPYPVSPVLGENLTPDELGERRRQLDPSGKSNIHLALPVSGATVGLDFNTGFIDTLSKKSDRFIYQVVLKTSPDTKSFLNKMTTRQEVKLTVSPSTRDIVERYEELYAREVISLEVTKPSEQAFKTLLSPNQRGGAILLFAKPIGRQEYDNLDFLKRHELLPGLGDQKFLWEKSRREVALSSKEQAELLGKVRHWRGLILPENPIQAADFTWWCLKEGIFTLMTDPVHQESGKWENEVGGDGVKRFWHQVAGLISES